MLEEQLETQAATVLTEDEIARLQAYARSLRREVQGDLRWLEETSALLRHLRGDLATVRSRLEDVAS